MNFEAESCYLIVRIHQRVPKPLLYGYNRKKLCLINVLKINFLAKTLPDFHAWLATTRSAPPPPAISSRARSASILVDGDEYGLSFSPILASWASSDLMNADVVDESRLDMRDHCRWLIRFLSRGDVVILSSVRSGKEPARTVAASSLASILARHSLNCADCKT